MYKIMAVNAGSSSLKFQLLEITKTSEEVLTEGIFEKIGQPEPIFTIKYQGNKDTKLVPEVKNHGDSVAMLLKVLVEKGIVKDLNEIKGVGHRILHCGEKYSDSVIMDEESIAVVESVNDLGPLHNPANLTGVRAFMEALPGVVNVGVFDTSFHLSMPDEAYMYACPYEWYEKYSIRKYGFHGTSHKYVAYRAAELLGKPLEELRIITCHIGNGASLAAVKYGKVVETSMGLTPLEGLVMGTRSGDIDPAILEFLAKKENMDVFQLVNMLNKKSGVFGVSGDLSSDFRDLENAAKEGNDKAQLARDVFTYNVAKYVGAYVAAMNGVDAIAFTAGVGENDGLVREDVVARLGFLGIELDKEANKKRGEDNIISTPDSKVTVCVIPTNEELAIARETLALVK